MGLIETALAFASEERERRAREDAARTKRQVRENNHDFATVMALRIGVSIPLDGTTIEHEEAGFHFYCRRTGGVLSGVDLLCRRDCQRCGKVATPGRRIDSLEDIASWVEEGKDWHDCDRQRVEEADDDDLLQHIYGPDVKSIEDEG